MIPRSAGYLSTAPGERGKEFSSSARGMSRRDTNVCEMTLRDLDLEIQRAGELIAKQMEHQHSLLQQRLSALEEVSVAIAGARTEDEFQEALDRASNGLELRDQELLESFVEFEDGLLHLEEGVLDLAAEQGWEKLADAQRQTEEFTASAEVADTQGQDTLLPKAAGADSGRIPSRVEELLEFVDLSHGEPPLVPECKKKLRQAESLKSDLQVQWLADSSRARNQAERAACDDLFEEITKLEMIIKEIRSLIKFAKKRSAKSERTGSGRPRPKRSAAKKTSPKEQAGRKPAGTEPDAAAVSGREPQTVDLNAEEPQENVSERFYAMSADQIREYEEDYYHYRAIFIHLRRTARNPDEVQEALGLGDLLSTRREELRQWRDAGGCLGDPPRLAKDVFTPVGPDDSDVTSRQDKRGIVSKRKKKREPAVNREIREILRDLSQDPRGRRTEGSLGDLNRRVFLTAGRVNPRTSKRRGDW